MTVRLSHLLLAALVFITAAHADDRKMCTAPASECEKAIRQLSSGRRYLGAEIKELEPGIIIKAVIDDGPASRADLRPGDRLMSVNLKAVFFVSQAVLPWMVRQGGGAIVSLSSLAARVGGIVTAPDYATSKAGVIGLTRTLARQYGPKGIRVNAVAPGPIMTEMTRHWSEDVRREFIARIPLRRLGTAEDVASVVVFLAGPESGYITGATIDINGGLHMS